MNRNPALVPDAHILRAKEFRVFGADHLGHADLTLPERETEDRADFRQRQYDLIADAVRQNLDMDKIRQIMEKT